MGAEWRNCSAGLPAGCSVDHPVHVCFMSEISGFTLKGIIPLEPTNAICLQSARLLPFFAATVDLATEVGLRSGTIAADPGAAA